MGIFKSPAVHLQLPVCWLVTYREEQGKKSQPSACRAPEADANPVRVLPAGSAGEKPFPASQGSRLLPQTASRNSKAP